MSKSEIEMLNREYTKKLQEKGLTSFLLYKPFGDEYWNIKKEAGKIAFCNIEPYDKNKVMSGITTLDFDLFEKYWISSKTGKMTSIFNHCLINALDNDKIFEENEIRKINFKNSYSIIAENMYYTAYFNLRNSFNYRVQQDIKVVTEISNELFFKKYIPEYISKIEADYLIIGGKVSLNIINKIFPELNLNFDCCKKYNKILFVSIKHPSRIGYKYISNKIQQIINA